MNFVRARDGARLAYAESGAGFGPVIVFSHCLGGSKAVWAQLIERLQSRYRCIAYDLRGQGESESTAGEYSMAQLAGDALDLLDGLEIERCVFAGISMGGMVAQQLALLAPERLSALILADTAGGFDPAGRGAWAERIAQVRRDGVAPMVDTMMGRWFTDGFRKTHPEIVAPIASALASADVEGYVSSCAAIRDHDLRHRLAEIALPTLVVCGEHDPSTPLPLSEALAAGIRGAQLTVLPGLNHLPCVEAPDALSGVIENFLRPKEVPFLGQVR